MVHLCLEIKDVSPGVSRFVVRSEVYRIVLGKIMWEFLVFVLECLAEGLCHSNPPYPPFCQRGELNEFT